MSIIIAANTGNLGRAYNLAQLILLFDKFGHAFLYGGMPLLMGLPIPSMMRRPKHLLANGSRFPLGSGLILLFSMLEELSQLFLIHRNFDLVNLVTITAGGFLASIYINCNVALKQDET